MRKYGRYTRRKFLRDSALFSAGLAGLSLAGCTTTTTQPVTTTTTTASTPVVPTTGGTLRVARWATSQVFDSRMGDPKESPQFWALVVQKLIAADNTGYMEKILCEDYTENSDYTQIDFTLRDGIKFHDDSDFTSRDIKDQMEVIIGVQDQPAKMKYTNNFYALESVDVDGDLGVTFNMSESAADFLDNMAVYNICYVVPSDYYTTLENQTALIGTGPYTFDVDNFDGGVTATMNRWSDYWGETQGMTGYWSGPCYVDKVISSMVKEEAVRWSSLQSGDTDLTDFMNASTFYSASFHAQQNDLPLTFYQGYTDSLQKFVFNLRNPPFDDPDYREALLMGIDWDTFNSVVYPNYDPYVDIFDGSDFEHPNQSSLAAMIPDYDPTTAADTVQGFIDDGARDYLNLLYSSTAAGGGSGEFLQTEYAKIGLTVNLLDKAGRDYRVFQNKNEMPDDPVAEPETWWDILPGTTGGSIRGIAPGALSGIFNSYYSDAGLHTAVDDFGTNLGGINDPQLDTWVLAAKGAQPSERHTIYNDIQEYILTNHLYHPTVIDMKFWAWSDDLKGLEDLALSWRNNEYSMSGLWLDR